jgi:hypothetical protein
MIPSEVYTLHSVSLVGVSTREFPIGRDSEIRIPTALSSYPAKIRAEIIGTILCDVAKKFGLEETFIVPKTYKSQTGLYCISFAI